MLRCFAGVFYGGVVVEGSDGQDWRRSPISVIACFCVVAFEGQSEPDIRIPRAFGRSCER